LAATYNFKILTPGATALDEEVVSVVAPGEAGYLGVLANHAPLITTLRPGELKVRFHDNREARYSIGAGIFKVARNQAVLLTESIESQEG
jgi:F-type H+-transporting ATPase subunit epsilon